MTDDEKAHLAAIIENPDDDTPRLVYADFLDEHGRHERAEFVRVQCELARRPPCEFADTPVSCPRYNEGRPRPVFCPTCEKTDALRGQERELIEEHGFDWFERSVPGLDLVPCLNPSHPLKGHDDVAFATVRRGFAEVVSVTAADWLAHGDAIFQRHPVRTVRLTTRPLVLGWGVPNGQLLAILADRWEGVEFELPPEPAWRGYTTGHQYQAIPEEELRDRIRRATEWTTFPPPDLT